MIKQIIQILIIYKLIRDISPERIPRDESDTLLAQVSLNGFKVTSEINNNDMILYTKNQVYKASIYPERLILENETNPLEIYSRPIIAISNEYNLNGTYKNQSGAILHIKGNRQNPYSQIIYQLINKNNNSAKRIQLDKNQINIIPQDTLRKDFIYPLYSDNETYIIYVNNNNELIGCIYIENEFLVKIPYCIYRIYITLKTLQYHSSINSYLSEFTQSSCTCKKNNQNYINQINGIILEDLLKYMIQNCNVLVCKRFKIEKEINGPGSLKVTSLKVDKTCTTDKCIQEIKYPSYELKKIYEDIAYETIKKYKRQNINIPFAAVSNNYLKYGYFDNNLYPIINYTLVGMKSIYIIESLDENITVSSFNEDMKDDISILYDIKVDCNYCRKHEYDSNYIKTTEISKDGYPITIYTHIIKETYLKYAVYVPKEIREEYNSISTRYSNNKEQLIEELNNQMKKLKMKKLEIKESEIGKIENTKPTRSLKDKIKIKPDENCINGSILICEMEYSLDKSECQRKYIKNKNNKYIECCQMCLINNL